MHGGLGLRNLPHGAVVAGEQAQIGRSYRKGIYKGLSKIISKMGICTVSSYRGAQLFEIVGLDPEVVDLCFADTPARIGGVSFARLDIEARQLCARAWNELQPPEIGGDHFRSSAVFLTQSHPKKTQGSDVQAGTSLSVRGLTAG